MSKFYYLEIGDGYTSEGKEQSLIPPELLKKLKEQMEKAKKYCRTIKMEIFEWLQYEFVAENG